MVEEKYEAALSHWSAAAEKILLVQVSSAASEIVFSLLNNSFGLKQNSSFEKQVYFYKTMTVSVMIFFQSIMRHKILGHNRASGEESEHSIIKSILCIGLQTDTYTDTQMPIQILHRFLHTQMPIQIPTHTDAYTDPYTHRCLHRSLHRFLHTQIPTQMPTQISTHTDAYTDPYTHRCLHRFLHTQMHTQIPTHTLYYSIMLIPFGRSMAEHWHGLPLKGVTDVKLVGVPLQDYMGKQ